MISMIVHPSLRSLEYSFFSPGDRRPKLSGSVAWNFAPGSAASEALAQALAAWRQKQPAGPEAICVRVPHGGDIFTRPVIADEQAIKKLQTLVPAAPLHLPLAINVIGAAMKIGVPVVLAFDTAFFASLPPREHLYGLSQGGAGARYGYHGLYHQAACSACAGVSGAGRGQRSGPSRVISICLEPRPEIAAAIGPNAVMVTSGATPLEGLPGATSCGELDPGIILAMAREMKWGPEEINAVLTQKSGIFALAGKRVSLDTVLKPRSPYRLARDVIRYRILLACGSAIAAMGGLDAIVFSGRYGHCGPDSLGNWLVKKLTWNVGPTAVGVHLLHDRLDQILAETATATIREASDQATLAS